VNLLAANTWWPHRYTTPAELENAPGEEKGIWMEWAVAAELFRRAAIRGDVTPLQSLFWRTDSREVDFVRRGRPWIEVKTGKAAPFEFDWFRHSFPQEQLLVVSSDRFESEAIRGVTLEDFLLDEAL
jgi:predicted AAA+ superfamily ATPase